MFVAGVAPVGGGGLTSGLIQGMGGAGRRAKVVGAAGGSFDPVAHLEGLIGRSLPNREIRRRRRSRDLALTATMDARPGVRSVVAEAQEQGRLEEGTRVLVSAVGAGLTWGSAYMTWTSRDGR